MNVFFAWQDVFAVFGLHLEGLQLRVLCSKNSKPIAKQVQEREKEREQAFVASAPISGGWEFRVPQKRD